MFVSMKQKSRTSSRSQIAIKQVKDGILELPNYQYRVILEATPVNFELKSEEEQDAIIDTYEGFLNSIGYPLQILIRTREIDMDKYLEELSARLDSESEEVYRNQLSNYDEFIRSLITNNKILTRQFYVVIPHAGSSREEFELIKEQLSLGVDIVSKGLTRLGMSSRQLSSLEVLDLFYSFYSPEKSKTQPLTDQAVGLVHEALVTRSHLKTRKKEFSVVGGVIDDFSKLPEFEEIEMIIKESRHES